MMAWTDDKIEQLRKHWEAGMTASRIAEIIGGGVSRNGVISKANRLGLSARLNPAATREQMFQRVCDLVIDAPRGRPVSITAAAGQVGMNPAIAQNMWDDRIVATHGGEPA